MGVREYTSQDIQNPNIFTPVGPSLMPSTPVRHTLVARWAVDVFTGTGHGTKLAHTPDRDMRGGSVEKDVGCWGMI